ncbi:MAG: recombination regulator RecX [Oligoflexia bacterium]|nr:recombination regulator RecX [Oligoflexia bacterium]
MSSEKPDTRALALRRLAAREYAAAELRGYLERKGVEEAEAQEVVNALVREGWVDDRRFARAFARDQVIRGKGPMHILAGLRRKGVRIELSEVRGIFAEVSDRNELETARALVERRYPRASRDPKVSRRAFQALLRRGFSAETARKCLPLLSRGSSSEAF